MTATTEPTWEQSQEEYERFARNFRLNWPETNLTDEQIISNAKTMVRKLNTENKTFNGYAVDVMALYSVDDPTARGILSLTVGQLTGVTFGPY